MTAWYLYYATKHQNIQILHVPETEAVLVDILRQLIFNLFFAIEFSQWRFNRRISQKIQQQLKKVNINKL